MKYLLGMDIGSSSAKAGLFSPDGRLVASSSREYPTREPNPGWKEQDPETWWMAACAILQEVTFGGRGSDVSAVGVTGHISSLTFVDPQGRPLRPAVGFQDQRAVEEVSILCSRISREELAAELGIDLPPAATWPLPRLLWFQRHQPAILENAFRVLQAKDFVNFRLTGELRSDLSSGRGMVSFAEGQVAARVFEKLNLPRHLVPPIARPHEVIGSVTHAAAAQTGLSPGIPVVAGWNDLNAAVLGSGVVSDGQWFNITGTSEHLGVITAANHSSAELVCAPFLPGKRLLYGVTSCGGGSLDWFRQSSGKDLADLLDEAEQAPPGSEGLLFLPYLAGERAPIWDPYASGAFLGIRLCHRRGHFVRAVLEGVALGLRQIFELVVRNFAGSPVPLVVSGGASRVALWNQIKADVLGREVRATAFPHAGVLGAALLAAVGAGLFPDPESASRALVKPDGSCVPQPEAAGRYEELYSIFEDLYPALAPVFHRIHRLHFVNRESSCITSTR